MVVSVDQELVLSVSAAAFQCRICIPLSLIPVLVIGSRWNSHAKAYLTNFFTTWSWESSPLRSIPSFSSSPSSSLFSDNARRRDWVLWDDSSSDSSSSLTCCCVLAARSGRGVVCGPTLLNLNSPPDDLCGRQKAYFRRPLIPETRYGEKLWSRLSSSCGSVLAVI